MNVPTEQWLLETFAARLAAEANSLEVTGKKVFRAGNGQVALPTHSFAELSDFAAAVSQRRRELGSKNRDLTALALPIGQRLAEKDLTPIQQELQRALDAVELASAKPFHRQWMPWLNDLGPQLRSLPEKVEALFDALPETIGRNELLDVFEGDVGADEAELLTASCELHGLVQSHRASTIADHRQSWQQLASDLADGVGHLAPQWLVAFRAMESFRAHTGSNVGEKPVIRVRTALLQSPIDQLREELILHFQTDSIAKATLARSQALRIVTEGVPGLNGTVDCLAPLLSVPRSQFLESFLVSGYYPKPFELLGKDDDQLKLIMRAQVVDFAMTEYGVDLTAAMEALAPVGLQQSL